MSAVNSVLSTSELLNGNDNYAMTSLLCHLKELRVVSKLTGTALIRVMTGTSITDFENIPILRRHRY